MIWETIELEYLLDTSYLLPLISIPINVGVGSLKFNQQFKEIKNTLKDGLVISLASIIEIQWKAIRLFKKEGNEEFLSRAQVAIPLLSKGQEIKVINPWTDEIILNFANELLKAGHNDFMDCLIFATAKKYDIPIVSEEEEIKKIFHSLTNWKSIEILKWKSFTKRIISSRIE